MYDFMVEILWYVILASIFVLAVMFLFLINARVNLKRRIDNIRFFHRVVEYSSISNSSFEAAEKLGLKLDAYTQYCRDKSIDTPEIRNEKAEKVERERQLQEKRMIEEEARWSAEQDRIAEEQRKTREAELKERRKTGLR